MKVWTDANGNPRLGGTGIDPAIMKAALEAWREPAASVDAVLAEHGVTWQPGCTTYYAYVRELVRRAPIDGKRRMGVGRPPAFTREQEATICEDYRAGMSLNTLSRDYGRHRTSIARVLEKHGIKRRSRGWNKGFHRGAA